MRRLWRQFWDAFWTAFDRARSRRSRPPVPTVPFAFRDDLAHPVVVPLADAPHFLNALHQLHREAGTRQEKQH